MEGLGGEEEEEGDGFMKRVFLCVCSWAVREKGTVSVKSLLSPRIPLAVMAIGVPPPPGSCCTVIATDTHTHTHTLLHTVL